MDDFYVKRLSEGMGVEILTDGGDRAYYSPSQDKIHLPTPESFHSEYAFNSTALHEEAHASGHPNRLNRPQSAFFGTDQYAYEELELRDVLLFYGFRTENGSNTGTYRKP